jgi:conjugal transfer mating pair stabilization protein TraG
LEERDYLIRTMAFEAQYESKRGKAAVAHVILNRKKSGRWGDNIKGVVTQPWQFEPWMTRREEVEALSPNDHRYRSAARIADAVLAGEIPDPTAGATHFLNPKIVRERRGGSLPSWASGEGLTIGRHTFYSPEKGGSASHRLAMSLAAMARTIFLQHAQRPC